MSSLSKHFAEVTKHRPCSILLHPDKTCIQHFITMTWIHFYTLGRYYLPTLVLPLVLKINSINREMFLQALIDYGKCILIGNFLVTVGLGGVCWFHKIFGSLYFPWFIRIPFTFGTIMFNFYPERIKRWQSTGLLNMYFETMIKKSENTIISFLRKSRVSGTLMFMGISALVMAGFKMTGVNRFWFVSMPKTTEDKSQLCDHGGICSNYIKNEFFSSSKLALVLALLKFIISNYKRIRLNQPITAVKLLVQKLDYNMIGFTIFYRTVFKLLYCWFNNRTGENSVKNVMAAGFFSGIAYSIYPIYMVFTHGLTASIQMSWLMYSNYIASRINNTDNNFIKKSSQIINFINKLPIATIVTSVCLIQLVLFRLQYPYATPFYVHNFITVGTNKQFDRMVERCAIEL